MNPSDRLESPGTDVDIAEAGAGAITARRALSWARIALAGALIAIALLLGALRFGLPAIENHRPQVERWVGELLQRPVSIDSLRAYWQGWSPALEIHGLKLHRAEGDATADEAAITFDRVRISVDPVESLKSRRLLAHALIIEGAALTVIRRQDGSIFIAGMQPANGASTGKMPEDLARWILKEGTLVFDSTTVSWVDARRGNAPVLLTGARIELSNAGDTHHLSGAFRIPGISDERIQFVLDAEGDLSGSSWSGDMVVSANDVRPSQLAALLKTGRDWFSGGRTDLSVWARWKQGAIERARVKVRADGLMLSEGLGGLRVHGGTAEVDMGRLDNGWSAAVVLQGVHTSQGRWRTSRGWLNYLVDAGGGGPRLVGKFEHARLADLARLLKTRLEGIEFASAAVETYRPSAELHDLHFSLGLGGDSAAPLALSADFDRFSAIVGPAFPALSGYSGHIEIDGDSGVVSINGGTLDFALAEVFESRFLVETQGGRVAWRREANELRLDVYDVGVSAAGIDGRLAGFAHWDGNASGPMLNLVASLSSDDVAGLKGYIPAGIINPKLSHWLRRGIRGGRLTKGKLLLHGRISDFPFDGGDGIFEANFALADGELEYANGWPGLSELTGELRFRGRRIEATISQGRILDSRFNNASIAIDRLGEGVEVVEIRGDVTGKASEGLRFLGESPLKQRFSDHLSRIAATGEIDLNVVLDVPLDKSGIRLDGRVDLNGNSIDFPLLRSGLDRVQGTLRFNRHGARAKSIHAFYLGEPVTVGVVTRPKAPHDIRIQIAGRANKQMVAKHLSNSGFQTGAGVASADWIERLDGEVDWTATINVPAIDAGDRGSPTIRVESSLEGMGIDLPYPVGKAAGTVRPLAISMESGGSERRAVQIRYGEDTHAAIELELQDGRQMVRKGAVRFGGGEAELPQNDGIFIGGSLTHLNAGEWVHAWKSAFETSSAKVQRRNALKQVSLEIGRLGLLGSNFDQTRVYAFRDEDGSWTTRFDGEHLKGTVHLLASSAEGAFLATFEIIDYRVAPGENETRVANPRDIPPIRLMSERFIFNGRELGVVRLSATPTPAGLNFGEISIDSREFEARANGFWHAENGSHRSEFSVSVHSESLGGFLESMGFGGTDTSGGATDVFLNARWQASPMGFDLRQLNGALHFRSVEGRLLGVKRGATERIFGLLSVTTLPQRLILNFADLFEEGVSFNSIEGRFNLANGEAYTNNLVMETDTARVEIAGRTGLVTEDYDQVMTVTPKLTSSLPLAPIWLVEKAFNRRLFGKTFSSQYTITGSWADPKVEPIVVEANPAEKG